MISPEMLAAYNKLPLKFRGVEISLSNDENHVKQKLHDWQVCAEYREFAKDILVEELALTLATSDVEYKLRQSLVLSLLKKLHAIDIVSILQPEENEDESPN